MQFISINSVDILICSFEVTWIHMCLRSICRPSLTSINKWYNLQCVCACFKLLIKRFMSVVLIVIVCTSFSLIFCLFTFYNSMIPHLFSLNAFLSWKWHYLSKIMCWNSSPKIILLSVSKLFVFYWFMP